MLAQECYSRRDNQLFHGFPEDKNEKSDDCENKVRQMLTDMDISESDIRIVRCHRKGAKKNTDRPRIVRFHWFGDIKLIMSKNADLRKKSKNMNKFVTQDWPVEIEKKRRMLLPVLHRAKAAKYNARLIIDKLIVNNKTYTLDNLHELPEDINPKKISTVENDDMMLFWGKYVPLSTFHIHNFKVNQVQVSSIEQALQYEKAMLFEDGELAGKLITEKDPLVCKMLGKQARILNNKSEKTPVMTL